MRSLLVAAISLALAASATAATRPRYWGTIVVQASERTIVLDPAELAKYSHNHSLNIDLARLMFDTLVTVNDRGAVQPSLAAKWEQQTPQRWQFTLRSGVYFADGTLLTGDHVCESLRVSQAQGDCSATGELVVLESSTPQDQLPALLAAPQYSIALRKPDSPPVGTGSFALSQFAPEGKLLLVANDGHWAGQPYADRIEVHIGIPYRRQLSDLEAGRADVVQTTPDQVKSVERKHRVAASTPVLLYVLTFLPESAQSQNLRLRQAIAATMDREPMLNVIAQRQGEVAHGFTPRWLTGYGFLLAQPPDIARARELRGNTSIAPLTLVHDVDDPIANGLAQRVAVNARDAGIHVQVLAETATSPTRRADLRLMKLRISTTDAASALAGIAGAVGMSLPARLSSPEELLQAEQELVESFRAIPLIAVPQFTATSPRLRNWRGPRTGGLPLADAWLEQAP